MAEDAWHTCTCKALLHWMKLSRPTGSVQLKYCNILKISLGAYIFQRPFLRGLFLEGLIFGGACLWRELCISQSIGLTIQLAVNLPFLLCFTLYLRAVFQVQAPGGLYLEGRFDRGFFALQDWGAYIFEGLIHGGAYFRNFTVGHCLHNDVILLYYYHNEQGFALLCKFRASVIQTSLG